MAHARTIKPPCMRSQDRLARLLPRMSGAVREALGSEGEKSRGNNSLTVDTEVPERFATVAKRSEKIAQVLAPPHSSAAFTSDSRGAFL